MHKCSLELVSHLDVHGGPQRASWYYRCELAGPSSTSWQTRSAASVLHLRWLINTARKGLENGEAKQSE